MNINLSITEEATKKQISNILIQKTCREIMKNYYYLTKRQ